MELTFNWKLAFYLILAFILFTIIGTLSHEFGHYIAGKYVGFDTRINYESTIFLDKDINDNFKEIKKLSKKYLSEKDIVQKEIIYKRLKKLSDNFKFDYKIFTLGGPIQTLLTSIIGLSLLIYFRKKYFEAAVLVYWQWLIIFLSLFWLRQSTNMVVRLFSNFIFGTQNSNSDEYKLTLYYQLPKDSILIVTGIIGFIILAVIVFKFIPIKQRFTFLISGLVGGVAGYYLWIIQFGKYILP